MRNITDVSGVLFAFTITMAASTIGNPTRPCGSCTTETFINPVEASSRTVAEAVAHGHSFLIVDLASMSECRALHAAAVDVARDMEDARQGLKRFAVTDHLSDSMLELCDRILLRLLSTLNDGIPALLPALFGDALMPSTVIHNPRLDWSPHEPAINLYSAGGTFKPHEDEQSLTCLLNLSESNEYNGGGTAFWHALEREEDGSIAFARSQCERATPAHTCRPPPGKALVFGGQVTHAGVRVVDGLRVVFVASFSPVPPRMARGIGEALAPESASDGARPKS